MNTISANKISENAAAFLTVDEASEGQRVDNYLTKMLKGVPKSHVYRILRSGEVRVNKKRIAADFRLSLGDVVRIPPTRSTAVDKPESNTPVAAKFANNMVNKSNNEIIRLFSLVRLLGPNKSGFIVKAIIKIKQISTTNMIGFFMIFAGFN